MEKMMEKMVVRYSNFDNIKDCPYSLRWENSRDLVFLDKRNMSVSELVSEIKENFLNVAEELYEYGRENSMSELNLILLNLDTSKKKEIFEEIKKLFPNGIRREKQIA